MRFEIVPLIGVGPARFGVPRDELRAAMKVAPTPFRKTSNDRWETDAFFDSAFQVFYGGDEPRVEYVELSRDSALIPFIDGMDIFATPATDLVARIERQASFDRNDPELGYSYVFPALELALWRPAIPASDGSGDGRFFSTVGVGVRGYFVRSSGNNAF
jgi:hypothetical protein